MSIIGLVVVVLVLAILYWALERILVAFSVAEPIRTVVLVLFALLAVLWLLSAVGLLPLGSPILRVR